MRSLRPLLLWSSLGLVAWAGYAVSQVIPSPAVTGIGCAFNTVPPTLTSGQAGWAQCDSTGKLITSGGSSGGSGLAFTTATLNPWTSATAANATQLAMPISTAYGSGVIIQLDQTTTISAGAVTFQGTYDGSNWENILAANIFNASVGQCSSATNPYTLVASTNQPFVIANPGYQSIRIQLSTQITGSGSVTPFVTLLPYLPFDPALCNPLSAGSAIIGKVGIDQTTPGTTNGVQALAGATGGATVSSAIAPATPAGVNLKAAAGTLYALYATTIQATPVYVKFYNSASAPTCGSGTPIARFMIPAASTAANGAGTNIPIPTVGIALGTGIGYCVTGALADNDTTAITAANTLVNIVWK